MAPAAKEAPELHQLACRIPKTLHRAFKLYCVKGDLRVQDEVAAALAARMAKGGKKK